MKRFDHAALKQAAREDLSHASADTGRTVLIHTGASVATIFLLAVLDYFLNRQIGTTGGLSGLDRRAMLSTVQMVLRFLYVALLPFWLIGYTFFTLQLSQRSEAGPASLLEGFNRFNAVLRLLFLKSFLIGGVLFFGIQVGYFLFCFTPWAAPLLEVAQTIVESGESVHILLLEEDMFAAFLEVKFPLLSTMILTALIFGAPIFYRFRLADLYLLEHPEKGAFRALAASTRLMRGSYGAMFRLDLHFLWYHGLNLLILLIGCAGIILSVAEIQVPIPSDVVPMIAAALYALLSLAVAWWQKNPVRLAYVHAYEILQDPPEEPEPEPGSQPWTY